MTDVMVMAKEKKRDEKPQQDTKDSKVIRVSMDVDGVLKSKAKVGETPDDVLRRILGLPPKPQRGWR